MILENTERLLRISDVMARTALSRGHIYRLIRQDEFPAPRKLGTKCARWVESEIVNWIEQKS